MRLYAKYLDDFVFLGIGCIYIFGIISRLDDQSFNGWPQGHNRGRYLGIHIQIDPIIDTNDA